MRLPREVEADVRAPGLLRGLAASARPLWAGGSVGVPEARLTVELAEALRSAHTAGRVVRGLEGAQRALEAQARGLREADLKTGQVRGERISRLLVLSDDGAERFYRQVESLLRRHGGRVMAVRLDADAARLGGLLFGAGRIARVLMVEHKAAVSAVLLAISPQWEEGAGP